MSRSFRIPGTLRSAISRIVRTIRPTASRAGVSRFQAKSRTQGVFFRGTRRACRSKAAKRPSPDLRAPRRTKCSATRARLCLVAEQGHHPAGLEQSPPPPAFPQRPPPTQGGTRSPPASLRTSHRDRRNVPLTTSASPLSPSIPSSLARIGPLSKSLQNRRLAPACSSHTTAPSQPPSRAHRWYTPPELYRTCPPKPQAPLERIPKRQDPRFLRVNLDAPLLPQALRSKTARERQSN